MSTMKAISIRQPWADLIVNGGQVDYGHGLKDIENRTWRTKYRGRILIHAAKAPDKVKYAELRNNRVLYPRLDDLPHGAIIGSVEIIDCVTESDSPWFTGPYGFVLANPEPCDPVPYKGRLSLFNVEWPT